ncbi:uncharacterized protein LOC129790910 isoform X2 [Lutzomyia longipalpis]|uniref:uncharacterized protein LOC129790910 isoform X2 n=1 Tax=Lutzomyia longipalpis TaxID=7200 RepID=UPI00248331E3|nr:uncharacterized protein LOC129790910 isoform X2 [Lutzomyia longipalpis]
MEVREEMAIYEEAPEIPKQAREFLDLPLVDLMPTIAQYLTPRDLFALRSCSRYCRQLVDDVGFAHLGIVDLTDFGCGWNWWNSGSNNEIDISRNTLKHNIMLECRNAWKFKWNEDYLVDDILFKFLENNPLLEVFKVDCWGADLEQALQPLLHCKNLVVLNVKSILHVDDEFLRSLSRNNNNLKEIDFEFSKGLTPQGIKDFISKQPHLTKIGFPIISAEHQEGLIETIIESCKNLKTIKLQSWDNDNLYRLLIRLAECCKKLKKIDLRDEDYNWKENAALIGYILYNAAFCTSIIKGLEDYIL